MRLFVTGTDTDAGKTVVSAWLCLHSGADYWKPIQSGHPPDKDSDAVARLSGARIHPERHLLRQPLHPRQAAQLEDRRIDLDDFRLPETSRPLVIEGAGGVLVPINESSTMLDLMLRLGAPVVLAAKGVGRIFHHAQSLASGKVVYFVQMPGVAGIVHKHDRNGIGAKALFGIGQIERSCLGQHIAGHGNAARCGNGLKRSHKCQGRNQYLRLARYTALRGRGVHGEMEGRCSRIDGNDLISFYAKVLRHFLFKKAHLITHAKIAVFQKNTAYCTGFRFTHNGTGKTHGHDSLLLRGHWPGRA